MASKPPAPVAPASPRARNKPFPKDHPLHHASKELIAAVDFYHRMRDHEMGDFDLFDADWREFLRKIERVWNKTEAAAHEFPGWARIASEVNSLRKSDPLLLYLRQARNSDEHSIQPIVSDWEPNLRVAGVEGDQVTIQWAPWDRALTSVTNYQRQYPPAREHLGASFAGKLKRNVAEPIIVADLALRFYWAVIRRVAAEVVHPAIWPSSPLPRQKRGHSPSRPRKG